MTTVIDEYCIKTINLKIKEEIDLPKPHLWFFFNFKKKSYFFDAVEPEASCRPIEVLCFDRYETWRQKNAVLKHRKLLKCI